MAKVLRNVLISAYGFLFLQYLRITLTVNKDIIELEYKVRPNNALKKILHELRNQSRHYFTHEKILRLPTDLKYILKWTPVYSHSPSVFRNGQNAFIENNCAHYNCYLTNDKSLLEDPRYFDAILFDVHEQYWDDPPVIRSVHQKYVFRASESANNFPVCHPFFENFYNLTWTYKINSDVRSSYVDIHDKSGNLIGPKIDMHWIDPMLPTSEDVIQRLVHKKKAVAWFASHCVTKSGRENIAMNLKTELAKYNLKLDTFGFCGDLSCPRDRNDECLEMLEQDYYFYLAFENSLSEDYVTEKLLYPLMHFTVPIVYGGANYSRFLPPGSYINAGKLNATEVAFLMQKAIANPMEYRKYFRWHNHYVYKESPKVVELCEICKALNDPNKEHSVIKDFRKWWYPDYETRCKEQILEVKKADRQTANFKFDTL